MLLGLIARSIQLHPHGTPPFIERMKQAARGHGRAASGIEREFMTGQASQPREFPENSQ